MILTRLTITNFGVYSGSHEFDLRPRRIGNQVLPVVLIGGKNGAGKTTILESIRLCLYGRGALGLRVRKADYETYIKQRFHRRSDGKVPSRSARIGVVFEHVYAGEKSLYDAVRSWRMEGETLHESVSIYKDGTALRDIAPEYWNDFLRDLIPPGVADLFFFDGEQIQALADDNTEAAALESALGGLLNIDIVERLQSDLDTYIKQQDNQKRANLRSDLEYIVKARQDLEAVHQEHLQDRAGLEAQRQRIDSKVNRAKQGLISEGAQFIEQRTAIESRLEQIETELQLAHNQIRDLATGLLPFAFAPVWSNILQSRLQAEEALQRGKILFEYQQAKANDIVAKLRQNGFQQRVVPKLPDAEWHKLVAEIDSLLQPEAPDTELTVIHHVSEQQRYKLLQHIDDTLNSVPRQMQSLGQQLESLEKERSHLKDMLKQIPEDEVALPLIHEFQELSEQSGSLREQIARADEEIRQIQVQLDELERKRSKAWQKLAQAGDSDRRIDYAAKIQVVLEQYLERISGIKIEELEQLVGQYFNLLCRKDMIIKEVKIDPKNYMVKLYGDNRTELLKSELSAGEKQLYAMALLWALRAVSGRQLPIIVDTPMGRLDSDHRTRLLTEFFPNAAHQIVLLSTDTEVNDSAFEVLKPTISHVYRLDFDSQKGETVVEHAYFNTPSEEISA
jgi:DNA sulfur modification protein DndD